jgi:hypothetical protein
MEYLGRREYIGLPELRATNIEAKVDTGAYRSAVHCISCREMMVEGEKVLEASFNLDGAGIKTIIFKQYSERLVRSSFGDSELRYCVKLVLKIGKKRISSEVSLTDRSDMRYQVLIGRKTLHRKYVVDVSRCYLTHSSPHI